MIICHKREKRGREKRDRITSFAIKSYKFSTTAFRSITSLLYDSGHNGRKRLVRKTRCSRVDDTRVMNDTSEHRLRRRKRPSVLETKRTRSRAPRQREKERREAVLVKFEKYGIILANQRIYATIYARGFSGARSRTRTGTIFSERVRDCG